MKTIALGNAEYIVGIEPVEGAPAGHCMLAFRKVGPVGAAVGQIVGLPDAQIDEMTDHAESVGIIFQSEDSARVVAHFLDVIINGSVNTATEL